MEILPQPDETSCGPTCLHAIYRAHGDEVSLEELSAEVPALGGGGTLGVHLANHALRRGYGATVYTYNLQVFDPTWFEAGAADLADRLERQLAGASGDKRRHATEAYLELLRRGGRVRMEDLSRELLADMLQGGRPVLAGVSATFLYRCARERDNKSDDVAGDPVGHFVVLHGYDPVAEAVAVADPYLGDTPFENRNYTVDVHRLVNALLLGIVTYDANLIVIEPPGAEAP